MREIYPGRNTVCALKQGGVLCWGENNVGQVGNGAAIPGSDVFVPTQVVGGLDRGVSELSFRGFFALPAPPAIEDIGHGIVLRNGKLHTWGANYWGMLGTSGSHLSTPALLTITP